MSKSDVKRTPEEVKERHEFKRKLKESTEKWYDQLFREQVDELCSPRRRIDNSEQG